MYIHRETFRAGAVCSQTVFLGRNIEYMCFWVQKSAKVMQTYVLGWKDLNAEVLNAVGFDLPVITGKKKEKTNEIWNRYQLFMNCAQKGR